MLQARICIVKNKSELNLRCFNPSFKKNTIDLMQSFNTNTFSK